MRAKFYYKVTRVWGCMVGKVGLPKTLLVYDEDMGGEKTETVFNTGTHECVGGWTMRRATRRERAPLEASR